MRRTLALAPVDTLRSTGRVPDEAVLADLPGTTSAEVRSGLRTLHEQRQLVPDDRGYVADLATVWRLASRWYAGRLDDGYRRREPAEAAAYFRGVGLRGPFWGLRDDD